MIHQNLNAGVVCLGLGLGLGFFFLRGQILVLKCSYEKIDVFFLVFFFVFYVFFAPTFPVLPPGEARSMHACSVRASYFCVCAEAAVCCLPVSVGRFR